MVKMAGFVGCVLLALAISQPITMAINATRPPRLSTASMDFTPHDMGLEYEDVRFPASDGVMLSGWFIFPVGVGNGAAVILSHQNGHNRVYMLLHAEPLAQRGYGVLIYDHRAQGDSEGQQVTSGWAEDQDVLGALAYLQSRPDVDRDRIGAAGLSLGAVASIRAAAQSSDIKAVWSDGLGGITLRDNLPPCNLMETLGTPSWMLFFTTHQIITGLPEPEAMSQTLARIAPRPIMLVIAGKMEVEVCTHQHWLNSINTGHIQHWTVDAGHISGMSTHREEYSRRLIAFFDAALRK
jgi:uncharacterized protein